MSEARAHDLPEPADDFRAEEQSALAQWLSADGGSAVVLHGPRGVGKARLAEFVKQEAGSKGEAAILEARCPAAGARSFHPYADIARQAMMWAEQRGLGDTLVDPIYPDLAPVIDHAASDEDGPDAPSLDQKLAFFEGFRRLLRGIATEGRLCAVVHDLERADADTLELTHYLLDELFGDDAMDPGPGARGMFLVLVREDEQSPDRIRDFLGEAVEHRGVRTLRLSGLDIDGLRRYVQSPHLLQKLLSASSGLPQEIDALIDALPDNVEELFERRLEQLERMPRELLMALAVSGRPSPARQLAEVSKHPVREVAKALNELRNARILSRRIQSGELQFGFTRRGDLEVAQRLLSAEDAQRLHGIWAKALSQDPDGGGPALLAYHQLRSAEPWRGVPLAIQAAETHAVAGAVNAAIEILEDAREHARGELELAILSRLAELAPLIGNPKRALRFVEAWKAALGPKDRAPALRKEAELYAAAGEHQRALDTVDAAHELLEGSEGESVELERARLQAVASEAHYHLSNLIEARDTCEAGLEHLAATGSGSIRIRLELLNQLGKIALADGDAARAIRFFEDTLASAEQHELGYEQARSLVNLGIVYLRRGEMAEALRHLERGIEQAGKVNDLTRLAFGHLSVGTLQHQVGEFGAAIDAYRECKSLFRRLGNRTQLARVLHNLGNLYLVCGDFERARSHNDEALRLAAMSGVERVVAVATVVDGVLHAEEGNDEAAESRLREGMSLHQRLGGERVAEAMIELAELHVRGGQHERARSLLDEIESALDELEAPALDGRTHLLRGRLALGEEGALTHLERARDIFSSAGRRLFERDAELALARALHSVGRTETARAHLEQARRLQNAVAETLPPPLRAKFEGVRSQTESEAVAALLDGRADPSPSAPPAKPVVAEVVERKPEWQARYGAIIGRSAKLMRVFHILDRVANSEGTVLVVGESGTGKELVAEAIHHNSARSEGPFVKLNCAALVESLLLSELFGHERGSFTGAHQRKIGRFEMAAGGTLFLDEIGDISPKTQVALLRVLQEREFERVGGGQTLRLDARIVFATNRNLGQMVREGTFREDLYYRLKGITIDLPPLRERPEDILALAEHFLEEYASESGAPQKRLSADAADLLERYPWPGNIRELENIIRSVALFAETDAITGRDFDEYRELFQDAPQLAAPAPAAEVPSVVAAGEPRPAAPVAAPPASPAPAAPAPEPDLLGKIFDEGIPLPELKKQIQAEAIARALTMTDGNITKAADVLGMRRPRLSQIINAEESLKRLAKGTNR